MSNGVSPAQKFTRNQPCPICGGYAAAPRGRGKRCYGFLSSDGRYAHCTRDERAYQLPMVPGSNTYAHRRRDLDNILKPTLDALQGAGLYRDDCQIDVVHVVRWPAIPPEGELGIQLWRIE